MIAKRATNFAVAPEVSDFVACDFDVGRYVFAKHAVQSPAIGVCAGAVIAKYQMIALLEEWIGVTIYFQNLVEVAQANRKFILSAD